jgi:hypothetical protein
MAHFNTPGSYVRQASDYLVSITADVNSQFVSPATAFTLLARYKGVLSHWGLMLKCLEPNGGPLTDMFNKIKKKAKSVVQ